MQNRSHSIAVVGARGYSGLELCRILLRHPNAKLQACYATEHDWKLSDFLVNQAASQISVLPLKELSQSKYDTVFLATPAEVSLELAPELLSRGMNVIDLSGAFRLDSAGAEKWYGLKLPAKMQAAVYGLVPWAAPAKGAPILVSNPGCYATAVLMGVLPILKNKLVDPATLVIDAKSGASGAGKKAAENLLFTEVEGECLPYRVGKHQHLPEICRYVAEFSGTTIDPHFTTHLLPVRRGIIAGIYARLNPGVSAKDVAASFQAAYADYPLVSFGEDQAGLTSLKRVNGTARTHLSYTLKGDKLYLFSVIDNLLKGAASQAVENFNRSLDLPASTGMTEMESAI